MDWLIESVGFSALLAVATGLFWRFGRRPPEVAPDGVTLRHGPAVAALGWVCVAISAAAFGIGFFSPLPDRPVVHLVSVVGVGLGFGIPGL